MVSNNSTATRLKFDVFRRCNYFLARLGVDSKWNNEKKKNRRGKYIYIYIRNKIYLTHRYRNSHWCTTRHLFPLFQSNLGAGIVKDPRTRGGTIRDRMDNRREKLWKKNSQINRTLKLDAWAKFWCIEIRRILEPFLSIHTILCDYIDHVKYKIRICLISQSSERIFSTFAQFTLRSILSSICIIYLWKKGGSNTRERELLESNGYAKYMRVWVDAYSVEYASTDKFGLGWIIRAYNSDG